MACSHNGYCLSKSKKKPKKKTKIKQNKKKPNKKTPKYIIPIHYDNTGLEFISFLQLNSILYENDIINCLTECLREDER